MIDSSADNALFEAAFRDSAIGIALVALDGSWLKVNDALCRLLGYEREQLLALEYGTLVHESDRAVDQAQTSALREGAITSFQLEKRYLHSAGHTVWVQTCVSLARGSQGNAPFLLRQVKDMTAQRRAEAEARMFFDNSLDLLAIAETTGRLLRINPAWERALGYSQEELTSQPFIEFVHEEDRGPTREALAQLVAGNPVRSFRNRYRAKDGAFHWLEWNAQPEDTGRMFCIARDITSQVEQEELRARLEEEVRQAALIDPLTGIYNRRGFFLLAEQSLRAAMRHQRTLVLCFFDLNGLKEINDELGHDQGDGALFDVAQLFKLVFRNSDVVARLGGDEFAVLAESETSSAESALRQRIGDELARHNAEAARGYLLSTSMGFAAFDPRKPLSLAELLQRADRQMYEHKRLTRRSFAEQRV